MFDLRPVVYVIGLVVAVLGVTMLLPMMVDLFFGRPDWTVFLQSAIITVTFGAAMSIATANGVGGGLSVQQTFLLTTLIWVALPLFGALPFIFGEIQARPVDAIFEAMSGLTTTGSTVFSGLDAMPEGLLVWRSMLQWFGGIGIIVVAMVFLPELRVGGMQIFRSEAFDTMGKVLPRAAEIAGRITWIYLALTILNVLAYLLVGMTPFDAINHAFTTMSTGGFSTHDASFGVYQGAPEYVAAVFMILASLPFVRYIQLVAGTAQPLFRDSQIRAYLGTILVITLVMTIYRLVANGDHFEHGFREGVFNVTSIMSGTGYASVDYQLWGTFPIVAFFFLGLIGGCAGSTACSVKIFRYQILIAAIRARIMQILAPHGVFTPRFEGRPISEAVLSSVMAFFVMFVVSLGILAVLLSMTGLDMVTSLSGAATAIANIGPGLGDTIGPSGNFATLNDTAKWLLTAAMLVGRLELLSVYVLFTMRFWRG
ncbi:MULTISPECIES: TrkH family potassium uptake protein [Maritimibacter]|uniref:Trk system potassium uptake protein n=1 Tax=Maritimibacter alkaliphilus HTCC2654 TaxID=314271 RepID=A3VAA5_9RHOB|nr:MULTISPECIES: TrkH family potassium uptake protein [Maritimibacter]EAQ14846.1 Trk system potassium uptake protein TrkH [Maritimibacter alkaliphilus HTCC2654]MBL6426668.1 TrkH family potassium uptake protein [Maritimibacter sp.]TYP80926.1 trk system potassium uptake protein TrkH [Maritimibacter alkaliphilus HTCC2654]